jgi:hypothetical protein
MTTIKANVSEMFATREPWDCSNSQANLGDQAGRLTWQCALEVAERADKWLLSDRVEACESMQNWARETGGWDREEIAAWSDEECLALFVQNVASELREHLGADDNQLESCAQAYKVMTEESEGDHPIMGYYYTESDHVNVEYYTGI